MKKCEEDELVRRYQAGAKPLPQKPARVTGPLGGVPPAIVPTREPPPAFHVHDDGHLIQGRRVDVPARWLDRLRRGEVAALARLDLHGLSSDEAEKAVRVFIERSHRAGLGCVLVIHGRGLHSPSGLAILRGEIAGWLTQGKTAFWVRCFATARPSDGGAGALYVLLQRPVP